MISQNNQEIQDALEKKPVESTLFIHTMPKFATFTPVTPETFAVWKNKFEAEMFEIKRRQKNFMLEEELQLKATGKMFFMKLNKVDEVEIIDDDAAELSEEDFRKADSDQEEEPQRVSYTILIYYYSSINQMNIRIEL